jgi:UDP-N-acetyl-D-galactosamine dehydrogenase
MNRPCLGDFLNRTEQIAVIGLGYVGLPLANLLSTRFRVVGFDINARRIDELKAGVDRTEELTPEQLAASNLSYSCDPAVLASSRFIIVTVPTPIDAHNNPDLTPLVRASELVGRHISSGTTVVYESTVYPGCTEGDCLPLIAQGSGLRWKHDFFAGYSPERINPGDKEHTVDKIRKVVSGDTPETAALVRDIYGAVITAAAPRCSHPEGDTEPRPLRTRCDVLQPRP